MSNQNKNTSTKAGNLSSTFKAAAILNGDGALAYMLMSAFGITLTMLMSLAEKMLTDKDVSLIYMAMTAAVQIRNHVVFVGSDYKGLRVKYPELIIEGTRLQSDQLNYGALHALGHVFAHVTNNQLGKMILDKAGSAITGVNTTDSEAGKINKEMSDSWTTESKVEWNTWLTTAKSTHGVFLDATVAMVSGEATKFGKQLNGATTTPSSQGNPPMVVRTVVPAVKKADTTIVPGVKADDTT